jgi:hypothetical protein
MTNILPWVDILTPDIEPNCSIFNRLPNVRQLLQGRKGELDLVERLCRDVKRRIEEDKVFKFYCTANSSKYK